MGCDIHLAVERQKDDGTWERVLPPVEARDPWLVEQSAKDGMREWYQKRAEVTWYDDRNYQLFAVLANVRNGYGFAGVTTGIPLQPIAEPRGLPSDMSAEVAALENPQEENDDINLGDHSHSWLTVAELLAYPWSTGGVRVGVVTLTQFAERVAQHGNSLPIDSDTAPYTEWCGSTDGPGIVTLEAADVIVALSRGGLKRPAGERTHVRDSWRTPIASQCKDFVERTLPALQQVGPPDRVRIVFGFDS